MDWFKTPAIFVWSVLLFLAIGFFTTQLSAQAPGEEYPPKNPDPVEKLGDHLFRMGAIRIDTQKREVTVPGKITGAKLLEFIAATKSDFRTYESAIQLDANGLTFNVAMILIGLDKANAVPPRFHFDPTPPTGDQVEVWVEWKAGNETKRMRAEELLWDEEKDQRFPRAPWVYLGSIVLPDGRYRADLDGVIIGFVHDAASIIEWTGANGVGRFGRIKIDPKLGLGPGTPITVIVTAAGPPPKN